MPTSMLRRVRRLADSLAQSRIALAAYTTAFAIVVVPTVAVAVPWLVELHRLLRG